MVDAVSAQVGDEGTALWPSSAPGEGTTASSSSSLPSAFELPELPRECLVRIMSVLSAPDVCRMARVCRTLRAVADSDEVWARRLPSPFELMELPRNCLVRIMSVLSAPDVCRVCRTLRAVADSDEVWARRIMSVLSAPFLSMKDLFFRMRAGLLRKEPSQPYWLDPETGEGCFVKSARDLKIVWGDDQRYWHWVQQPDSWFPKSALLHKVCWFEVCGEFESMFLPGAYTVSFKVKIMDNVLHAWAWAVAPVQLFLSTSSGQCVESQCFFGRRNNRVVPNPAPLRPLTSSSWMELDIGEFFVYREMHVALKFGMMEVTGGQWKNGLILDCLKIQPTSAISKIS